MRMGKKLEVQDLVSIGVFVAIYFVIFFVSASLGMIPLMVPFFPVVSAILAGIPMILFFTRTDKFGAITILCALSGLINFAMGFGLQSLLGAIACGLVADLIMRAGCYKSWLHIVLGYIVFSEWTVFTMLPMWFNKEAYFKTARQTQGAQFAAEASALITNGMLVIVIVAVAMGAIIGAYLGRVVLKKHFKKAGIA